MFYFFIICFFVWVIAPRYLVLICFFFRSCFIAAIALLSSLFFCYILIHPFFAQELLRLVWKKTFSHSHAIAPVQCEAQFVKTRILLLNKGKTLLLLLLLLLLLILLLLLLLR